MPDKFSATWVSFSSISDYLTCPRAYFLNNVYKDSGTGHKITIMNPALALGQAVHEVVESLSILPVDQRFKEPLMNKFERVWKKVSGEKGGFESKDQERDYRVRGEAMLKRIITNPGPVGRLAVKMKQDLAHFWLSESDNIILCGKIDWLEYLPDEDAVHIIDFKTGKGEEDTKSLQLPIYYLLVSRCQHRRVAKASYWYLNRSDSLTEKVLPEMGEAETAVLKIAKEISLARKLQRFKCPHGEKGCYACRPLELVVAGKATFVGVNDFNQDIYVLPQNNSVEMGESEIL